MDKVSHGLRARKALTFLVAGLGALCLATSARAELHLCNQTSFVLRAAVAFKGAQDYVSAGWFSIFPGFCRAVIEKPLTENTYYIHARTISGHTGPMHHWAGDDRFCVAPNDFDITGAGECDKRGYDAAYFYAVDVGNAKTWTTTFTEPAAFELEKAQILGTQRLLADLGYLSFDSMDGYMGHSSVRAIDVYSRAVGKSFPAGASLELTRALASSAEERSKGVGFEICNRSQYAAWAAIGTPLGSQVSTRGWYEIKPAQCIKPIISRLNASFLYAYAETVDSAPKKLFWHGNDKLCVNDVMFELVGPPGECAQKALIPVNFRRIETQGREHWVYELKEPDASLEPGQ